MCKSFFLCVTSGLFRIRLTRSGRRMWAFYQCQTGGGAVFTWSLIMTVVTMPVLWTLLLLQETLNTWFIVILDLNKCWIMLHLWNNNLKWGERQLPVLKIRKDFGRKAFSLFNIGYDRNRIIRPEPEPKPEFRFRLAGTGSGFLNSGSGIKNRNLHFEIPVPVQKNRN